MVFLLIFQIQNVEVASEAALASDVAKMAAEAENLQRQLCSTLHKFDAISVEAATVESSVVDDVSVQILFRYVMFD